MKKDFVELSKNGLINKHQCMIKQNGKLIACFYIRGKSKKTDWLANNILAKKGWFTKPFDSEEDIRNRLKNGGFRIIDFEVRGSIVIFCAEKMQKGKLI